MMILAHSSVACHPDIVVDVLLQGGRSKGELKTGMSVPPNYCNDTLS